MAGLILIALATLISEDLACIATGVLVAKGQLGFWPGTLACLVGIFVGDILLFLAGRLVGHSELGRRILSPIIPAPDLDRASTWLRERGAVVALLSRFTPGMRLPTYFAAGFLKTNARRFFLWFLIASILWTPLLVGLATIVGEKAPRSAVTTAGHGATLALALAGVYFAGRLLIVRLLTFRTRRLALGRLKRVVRWEFWPPSVSYLPLVPYILYQGLKHGSFTLFAAANPGIPSGGLAGESKSRILEELSRSGRVPPYAVIRQPNSQEANTGLALRFMKCNGIGFPVVLKPDVGERGSGVAVVHSEDELARYFSTPRSDTIIQKYVEGVEFGIFYYRFPANETGRIFSITEKRFPMVTGDGKSTFADLVLRDSRAVCLASKYLRSAKVYREEILADGKSVPLVDVGSHSRGAIFLDGNRYRTADLEEAVDRAAKCHRGFFFGRFDVRAPSLSAFLAGDFQIMELNGVSAEAAHIYDPALDIWQAYRVLFRQWKIAFEIGAANRVRGAKPASLTELWDIVRRSGFPAGRAAGELQEELN